MQIHSSRYSHSGTHTHKFTASGWSRPPHHSCFCVVGTESSDTQSGIHAPLAGTAAPLVTSECDPWPRPGRTTALPPAGSSRLKSTDGSTRRQRATSRRRTRNGVRSGTGRYGVIRGGTEPYGAVRSGTGPHLGPALSDSLCAGHPWCRRARGHRAR